MAIGLVMILTVTQMFNRCMAKVHDQGAQNMLISSMEAILSKGELSRELQEAFQGHQYVKVAKVEALNGQLNFLQVAKKYVFINKDGKPSTREHAEQIYYV